MSLRLFTNVGLIMRPQVALTYFVFILIAVVLFLLALLHNVRFKVGRLVARKATLTAIV